MQILRKSNVLSLVLLMLTALTVFAVRQEPKALLITAKGTGTLMLGQEQFKIYSVVVNLMDDGKTQITLISDIEVFVSGTWSRVDDSQMKLRITGTATEGGIDAVGKLLLRNDGKSIDRLWIQGASTTTKRNLEVSFEAE